MKVLHLISCRGWSSDAYWAARATVELERAGHEVTLVCKRGADARVIDRAREAGARRIGILSFASSVKGEDLGDLRQLLGWLPAADVLHVHRGKEHWLAAAANHVSRTPRPLVRTRHIVQPIRPHALNRWLYRKATDRVVTVTEAIRGQYIAAEIVDPARVVWLPGGVDVSRFHPAVDGHPFRRSLNVAVDTPLIGLVSGLRVMKGHTVVIEAAVELARQGRRFHLVFVGRGSMEPQIRRALAQAGLDGRASVVGFVPDLPGVMAAFDIALYSPLESEGMSRVVFECLAMGKPLVASRVGVVTEVLEDSEHALLVPAGEPVVLARALARLLDDPSLRGKLGAAGAALARSSLSGAKLAERLGALYAALAGNRVGRTS